MTLVIHICAWRISLELFMVWLRCNIWVTVGTWHYERDDSDKQWTRKMVWTDLVGTLILSGLRIEYFGTIAFFLSSPGTSIHQF